MLTQGGIDGSTGLEWVDQLMPDGTTERRYLATLPTPDDHPMMAAPNLEDGAQIIPFTRQEIMQRLAERGGEITVDFPDVPTLDQDGQGACTAYAHTKGVMYLRAAMNEPFVLLSANYLYTLINRGRDAGSNAGDACQALTNHGIAPASVVHGRPLRPPGVSQEAENEAKRFKLRQYLRLNLIEEVWTAIAMLWPVTIDVRADSGYNTDSNGTVAFRGRNTNHEQLLFGGLRISPTHPDELEFLLHNSWGLSWGVQGMGWGREAHVLGSREIFMPQYVISDPNDTTIVRLV